MEERPNVESAPPKQAVIPPPMVQGKSAQHKRSVEEVCGWGPQCPICAQSASNLKTEDSKGEDCNGDRHKAKEEEKWGKGDQLKRNYYPQVHNTYHPTTSKIEYNTNTKQEEEEKG